MEKLRVLGMDPSLNNWGMAMGEYIVATGELQLLELKIIQPNYNNSKQVRKNSQDIERAGGLFFGAYAACLRAHAVFVEVPVGSQSARAMASYGICCGVLGSIRASQRSFIEVTPTEVKLATVGDKTASKQSIIERAHEKYPGINWPMSTRAGKKCLTASKAEHLADAIGAIEAGILTPPFKSLLNTLQTLP